MTIKCIKSINSIKSKKLKLLFQFISYALVGGSTYLIDIIVMNTLWTISGKSVGNINYLFKLISFIIYSTVGFQLNKRITFDSKKSGKTSYLQYISVVGLLSLVDAVVVSKLTLINLWSLKLRTWANICNLTSSATTGILGFLINKFIVFDKKN